MRAKWFTFAVLGLTLLFLLPPALLVAWVDPFFQHRAPGEEEVFQEERYENPGIAANSDYKNVLMGTSLVCNYRSSWFTEETGVSTVKLAYRDGYLSDFDAVMEVVKETHPALKQVWFGLDLNILIRPDSQRTVELPSYLYNQTIWDDAAYYWNRDVLLRCKTVLERRAAGTAEPIDDAYLLTRDNTFSREETLKNYKRPALQEEQLPEDAYFAACDENLAVVEEWLEAFPDTEFTIFFSPYSILYWDMVSRQGELDARLAALDRAVERLSGFDNVTLCFFMDRQEIITDLDNYMDYIHVSEEVSRSLALDMLRGEGRIEPDSWEQTLGTLEALVRSYDYDSIFD